MKSEVSLIAQCLGSFACNVTETFLQNVYVSVVTTIIKSSPAFVVLAVCNSSSLCCSQISRTRSISILSLLSDFFWSRVMLLLLLLQKSCTLLTQTSAAIQPATSLPVHQDSLALSNMTTESAVDSWIMLCDFPLLSPYTAMLLLLLSVF